MPKVWFDGSSVNISAMYIAVNGSLLNSEVNSNMPSIGFNGSSLNVSSTFLSVHSGLELTNIGNDSIPTLDAAPTTQTWATRGKLYFYRTTDAYSNPLMYLCVVSPFYLTLIKLCLVFFEAD